MPQTELNEFEYALIIQLREEAKRVTAGLSEEEQAKALSRLYAWRNDKIVTQAEKG